MSFIAVVAEQNGGKLHKMTLEAMDAGQVLAQELGLPYATVILGKGIGAAANALPRRVFALEHDLLEYYTADAYTEALETFIRIAKPDVILFPHTYQVRDYAPKLAARFGQSLISDVVRIKTEGSDITFVRQLFQGKLNADVRATGRPIFASIQAGAYRADAITPAAAQVEFHNPPLDASKIRQKPEEPFRESVREVDLGSANIIVSVGRGIKEKENIPMVEELAKAIGGELAASRPICDSGWLPMERQVGSSGQTVSPKVYIAVGISGAIQHLVGMKGAKTIVAINKDPNAPIFEVADYGICGDLFEVVPALTEEIKKARG
jgi:electron transfer flavoprotein alpha subunit